MLLLLLLAGLGLLTGALAFVGGRRRRLPWLLPLLLLLLCGKAVLQGRPDWEWALFPWPAYAYVQGFLLYPVATAFFGFAAASLPVAWNRGVVAAVGAVVLAHGVYRHAWLAWPEVHGEERFADAGCHLQQSTHYTCGPAACVAALAHCGVRISEREMAQLCLTRSNGSTVFDLYRGLLLALGERPFAVSIRNLDADAVLAGRHLVVCSNRGGGHALCLQPLGDVVVVHDPLQPTAAVWEPQQVQQEYRGPAIVIEAVDPR